MNELTAFAAIIGAWFSGFGFAGLADALWGFTAWDTRGIALTTFMWTVFGCIAIGLVIV